MEVIWSPRASAEFKAQVQWLEKHGSQKVASKYLEEVISAIERVVNPQAQYKLAKTKPEVRCYPVNKNITLFYRPGKNSVRLVTFFDTRQDPGKLRI